MTAMLFRIRFLVRLFVMDLHERVVGVRCWMCGARGRFHVETGDFGIVTRVPPRGWGFGLCFDANHHWRCGPCREMDG
jgi:hypothetical protein